MPKFRFIILEGPRAVISEREAISKINPFVCLSDHWNHFKIRNQTELVWTAVGRSRMWCLVWGFILEVVSDHNYELNLSYLASFANNLPRRKELEVGSLDFVPNLPRDFSFLSFFSEHFFVDCNCQVSLAWASSHYKLNPWRRYEQHQAGYWPTRGCQQDCKIYQMMFFFQFRCAYHVY